MRLRHNQCLQPYGDRWQPEKGRLSHVRKGDDVILLASKESKETKAPSAKRRVKLNPESQAKRRRNATLPFKHYPPIDVKPSRL